MSSSAFCRRTRRSSTKTKWRGRCINGRAKRLGADAADPFARGERKTVMTDLHELRRRFDEQIVNQHDLDAIPRWFATDFVDHVEIPGMPPGIDGVIARHQMLFTAMPDIHIAIHAVV